MGLVGQLSKALQKEMILSFGGSEINVRWCFLLVLSWGPQGKSITIVRKAPGTGQDSSYSLGGSVSGNQSGARAVSSEDNVPGTSHVPPLKVPPALYIFRVWTKFPAYDRSHTAHIQPQKTSGLKMESNKRERRSNSWCLKAECLLVKQMPLSKCSQRNQGGTWR